MSKKIKIEDVCVSMDDLHETLFMHCATQTKQNKKRHFGFLFN